MRIALINNVDRVIGGIESYLGSLIPALRTAGHQAAFVSEAALHGSRTMIPGVCDGDHWSVGQPGADDALARLSAWQPDVISAHGDLSPAFQRRFLGIAPAVYSAHNHYGTCISGLKTWQFPDVRVCHRQFGWKCLLHYYPHRCGGLNPVTMAQLYAKEKDRLNLLAAYRAIVTPSAYLRNEYINHGFNASQVFDLPYAISGAGDGRQYSGERSARLAASPGAPARVLFLGRMERLKGGELLLRALPEVRRRLARPVNLKLVGDGSDRVKWESVARAIQREDPAVEITFRGWLQKADMDPLWSDIDLIVVPSIWPEPFGIVGTEAALHGIPAAAFDIGGMGSWIEDGVNGRVAPSNPPAAAGLAEAIVGCLGNDEVYGRMARAAQQLSARFQISTHIPAFVGILSGSLQIPGNRTTQNILASYPC